MIQEDKDIFTKSILSIHPTRVAAVGEEIRLHNLYDVAKNPEYYNKAKQTSTGFDTTGTTRSESQIEKARQRMLGNTISNEAKNKISNSKIGKPRSEETKAKLSKANKGNSKGPMSELTKSKLSAAHKGKTRTQKSKDDQSKRMTGRKLSPETKAKMAISQKLRREKESQ